MADEVSITLKAGGVQKTVHPIFGDDIKMKFAREENQMFLRSKIDGKVKFSREDFDFIESCSHGVTFTLSVYLGSSLFGSCTFLKSDCTFNYDDRCCEVKIQTTDRYEDFLANYDNKYNLPKLAPEITALTLNKRPVLQFYFLHDTKITNCYGNMSFEVDARSGAEDYNYAQVQNCGFQEIGFFIAINIPNLTGLSSVYGMYWVNNGGTAGVGMKVWRKDNAYYLEYQYDSVHLAYYWQLYYANGTAYTVNSQYVYVSGHELSYPYHEYGNSVKRGTSYTDSTNLGNGTTYTRDVYARILSDYDGTISGETKKDLSTVTEDVAETNYNYKYAWSANTFGITSHLLVDDTVSTIPTEYGIDGDGKYFVKPTPSSPQNAIYPIGWSMWIPFSFWFESSPSLDDDMRAAFNTTYQLRDAYSLHSSIQKLLSQFASGVTFGNTSAYSDYFYNSSEGLHKLVDGPNVRYASLYITPITNVKKTRYEQPARKGDITLKQVLDMLRIVYQCYWYIDDSNRLRIEHVSFFKNNHTYAMGNPIADEDVTTMKDMPNGLMWTFGTNEIEFVRSNCPSRYEFEWGNDCTEQFKGYAIDIQDKFADTKKKEKANITNFTADIDYTVINPSGVSDDIYCLIEARDNQYEVEIPSVTLDTNTPVYQMQNGYCSILWTEKRNYMYDLGGWYARIEGYPQSVLGIRRAKKQGIVYPTTLAKVGTTGTIKTDIGIGLIDEQDVTADTLKTDTKILMEIERDFSNDVFKINIASHIGIRNNSEYKLSVYYITGNSSGNATVSPNSSYDTGLSTSTQFAITRIEQVGYVEFGELIKRAGSVMTRTLSMNAAGSDMEILGNGRNSGYDWAYVRVKFNKRTRINMTASSESNCDYGYVGALPYATKSAITANARGYVTGTGYKQVIAEAGEILFLGYTKDGTASSNNDKITFEIEVPE